MRDSPSENPDCDCSLPGLWKRTDSLSRAFARSSSSARFYDRRRRSVRFPVVRHLSVPILCRQPIHVSDHDYYCRDGLNVILESRVRVEKFRRFFFLETVFPSRRPDQAPRQTLPEPVPEPFRLVLFHHADAETSHGLSPLLVYPLPENQEDSNVEEGRDRERDVEGPSGRVEHVAGSLERQALVDTVHRIVAVVQRDVVPAEQGWNADGDGYDPGEGGVEGGLPGRSLLPIPDRVERGSESVEGDHAEIPDGRGAVEDVQDEPDVAEEAAEDPPTEALVDRRQGQDRGGQQEVAHRQVRDQVVGHGAQVSKPEIE